ncbi:MAG: GNAT family N-acetyltransferase [Acidobacteria bacterium]|nr:GNAT family N-acetyltransferase [Acidobacteriota bacterium]
MSCEPRRLRVAGPEDIPALRELIEASVLGLQSADYTPEQLAGALGSVLGVDTQLIADGTYFVVESDEGRVVACGGWSKRKTLFGADRLPGREPELLDPAMDAAKIRAFFVHPKWARRGIGTMMLQACERAAAEAGFRQFELGATLTGVPLYRRHGYEEVDRVSAPLSNGATYEVVRMQKTA